MSSTIVEHWTGMLSLDQPNPKPPGDPNCTQGVVESGSLWVIIMYIYLQKSGELYKVELTLAIGSLSKKEDILSAGGSLLGVGYSGHSEGKNNPDLESHKKVGPIPKGWYKMGEPECVPPEPIGPHGPYILPLTPDGHWACNRTGFLIHGDNTNHAASLGCIVIGRPVREHICASISRDLLVANLV